MKIIKKLIFHMEISNQRKEFEALFSDILFARFYRLYQEQNESTNPDGRIMAAARDYYLVTYNERRCSLYKRIKDNIQDQFGFTMKADSVSEYDLVPENNRTALEKMKKYIYSCIPTMTEEEKDELAAKVFDISKIGTIDGCDL